MFNQRTILDVQNIRVEFRIEKRKTLRAVSGVSFDIKQGETLGLVGESGCGKSSVARAIMQLPPPTSGRVLLEGDDLTEVSKKQLRQLRPKFQIVFQDSISALNPRQTIGAAIAMPLHIANNGSRSEQKFMVQKMMAQVGIDPEYYNLRPFELSGGQCQRVQIARALMTNPHLLICDEPVSSLDVSVQAQIINLLEDLRCRYGLTMLFISHDLAVVKNVCDRVAVMYMGKLCEIGSSDDLYRFPLHPYTEILLNAVARIEQPRALSDAQTDVMDSPFPAGSPPGCRFHQRCNMKQGICSETEPEMKRVRSDRWVACHVRE
ncbi:MAG: peptide ABC transporter ATP-binding protein [Desulfatitalea sp. BRH_c12]|nr:MAG: peptide ABC transporter ATP-binding protein [Desulfatitalea sp. BRH_c12]